MDLRTRLFTISMAIAALMTAVMVADRVQTHRAALIDKTQSRSGDLADLAAGRPPSTPSASAGRSGFPNSCRLSGK